LFGIATSFSLRSLHSNFPLIKKKILKFIISLIAYKVEKTSQGALPEFPLEPLIGFALAG